MTIISGIDLETTGLEWKEGHKIIEFACVPYELETGKKLEPVVMRINPERDIQPAAQKVHGITFEELADKPNFQAVSRQIASVIESSDILVAHNGFEFDFPFLDWELRSAGKKIHAKKLIDTMKDARWATPMGKLPSLRELCFACDVGYDPEKAHAAEYDVDVMMQCFFYAHKLGFFKVV